MKCNTFMDHSFNMRFRSDRDCDPNKSIQLMLTIVCICKTSRLMRIEPKLNGSYLNPTDTLSRVGSTELVLCRPIRAFNEFINTFGINYIIMAHKLHDSHVTNSIDVLSAIVACSSTLYNVISNSYNVYNGYNIVQND